MKLIGISGKIGTGKTTLARELAQLLGPRWIVRSFGDALKEEVAEVFGIELSRMYDDKDGTLNIKNWFNLRGETYQISPLDSLDTVWPWTIRQLLQWYGTEFAREKFGECYWNDRMERYLAGLSGVKGVIIDDVRFLSELDYVRNWSGGGVTIRLQPYWRWTRPEAIARHRSETELDGLLVGQWSKVINPRFGELPAKAKQLMEDFKKWDF